jgi:hypothetical protein
LTATKVRLSLTTFFVCMALGQPVGGPVSDQLSHAAPPIAAFILIALSSRYRQAAVLRRPAEFPDRAGLPGCALPILLPPLAGVDTDAKAVEMSTYATGRELRRSGMVGRLRKLVPHIAGQANLFSTPLRWRAKCAANARATAG